VADDRGASDGELALSSFDELESRTTDSHDGEAADRCSAADAEDVLQPSERTGSSASESRDDSTSDRTDAADTPSSGVRLAAVLGLMSVVVLTGTVGWLGMRAYQSHQAQVQRNFFLQTGRQAAVNLTTIDYNEAEADVQRILNSATGTFYDDFQRRSPAFVNVVQQARSKSAGTVTAAGIESEQGDHARVLVAVTVRSSNAAAADEPPRAWRMRIDVQRVGESAKVSNVEFVP
jgi:Mce-associated membrane protein